MKAYESNEVSWWSNWAEAKWLGRNAYVLFSQHFDEYFFNRGGFLRIKPDSKEFIVRMEDEFQARGRKPHLLLQSGELDAELLAVLAQRGYRIADQMAVMEADDTSFKVNPDVQIEAVEGKEDLEDWSRIYLDSFYGELRQRRAVLDIAKKLMKVKEASLLLASVKGKPVGVVALFRTEKVCGTYCVATHRDWRGKHVASTMLEHSRREAVDDGKKLVLQTILSDSTEGLYLKLGFRRAYLKELFVKDSGRVQR
jgi:N-acetylglutamate synthase-like GNAT family acetyltransferase